MVTVTRRTSIPSYKHTNRDRKFLRHVSSPKVLDSPGNKTYAKGLSHLKIRFSFARWDMLVSRSVFDIFPVFIIAYSLCMHMSYIYIYCTYIYILVYIIFRNTSCCFVCRKCWELLTVQVGAVSLRSED